MDHEICLQLLELDSPPSIIQFEYTNSPIESMNALMNRLTVLGYRFSRSRLDITAARQDPPGVEITSAMKMVFSVR